MMRLILAAVCCIAGGAAATFLVSSERQIAERRAAQRAFDRSAREALDALADVRAAQQAYVAAGQAVAPWMGKVDATMEMVSNTVLMLRQSATSTASKSALDDAEAILHELGDVDRRIRSYVKSGAQLMAADVIFTEGSRTAAGAARGVETARLDEEKDLDAFEAARRKQEAQALAGSAGLVILIVAALARSPRQAAANADPSPRQLAARHVAASTSTEEIPPISRETPPEMSRETPPESKPAATAGPADPSPRVPAPRLKAAAQLCTALGRVSDSQELQALIGRAADMLEASGLVLWMGTQSGDELRPAVAHGYAPHVVARIPPVPRSANNAAAAAYRTATLQIVLSRPGSARGAVVAPVVSADGCIGVLSAEVRDGGEASETVQALAEIIAAQLAGVLASAPAGNEGRSTGSAAM
jgi:hypothetical protein